MIEEYVSMDRCPDDFYEKFMEQRIQKINNPEKSSMEDSLPFPIEPLRTAPVPLPQKRVSNTSCDSGVNSPHALSRQSQYLLIYLSPILKHQLR